MKKITLAIASTALLISGAAFAASTDTPGHQMQENGSKAGSPGASGYAPGHNKTDSMTTGTSGTSGSSTSGTSSGTSGTSGTMNRSTTGTSTDSMKSGSGTTSGTSGTTSGSTGTKSGTSTSGTTAK